MLSVPDESNTEQLTLTFNFFEKPMNLMYYVSVREYDTKFIINSETIADLETLQKLNYGDSVTVRVRTAKNGDIKHCSVEIVEMKKTAKISFRYKNRGNL